MRNVKFMRIFTYPDRPLDLFSFLFFLLAHSYKYWEHLYNNRILTYFEVICSCDLLPIYSHKLLIVTSPWLPQQYL